MDASVEPRLQYLEDRVNTLETMLEVKAKPPTPLPARDPLPAPRPLPPERPAPYAPPTPAFDLEELLGGRVLAWVGGLAVFIAAVFFVVMAVHNGWIGVTARMVLAFAASTALVAFGAWLHERRGRMQVARAIVAAGLASLYASTAATTLHYGLISPAAGLLIAGAVGALALVTAVRWDSQEIAGLGIVGSLLAPVFVDAGTSTSALVFMTLALLAAIGVVVARGWPWLAVVAYVVSVPQAAAWLASEHETHLGLTLVVAAAFWLLYVVAALGYELREPAEALRVSSASLLFANASVAAAGGWWLVDDAGHRLGANAWLFGLAAAHLFLATLVVRSRASRDIAMLLYGVGATVLAVTLAVALGGPALVAAWSVEGIVLAWLSRRTDRPERVVMGALILAGLAVGHVLVFEARPDALAFGLHSIPEAVGGVALVVAACIGIGFAYRPLAEPLGWIAATLSVYLVSALVVDLAGAHAHESTQTSQLALSGFWAALGFGALFSGLAWRKRKLRLAGLGVLALAVGKVFIVDLAHLQSIWRVGSFLALGLLLLAAAFVYQRSKAALVDR